MFLIIPLPEKGVEGGRVDPARSHFAEWYRVSWGICHKIQSLVKTFLLSSENQSQNVPLPTPKLHHGAIFQQAIPKTWQEFFYTTLYITNPDESALRFCDCAYIYVMS